MWFHSYNIVGIEVSCPGRGGGGAEGGGLRLVSGFHPFLISCSVRPLMSNSWNLSNKNASNPTETKMKTGDDQQRRGCAGGY